MNNDQKTIAATESDRIVRDAYRASATETTPTHLDRQVLKNARQATHPATGNASLARRFRDLLGPAAVAATVIISLAVVLKFNGMEALPGSDEHLPGSRTSSVAGSDEPVNELAEAVESTGKMLHELDSAAESLQSGNQAAPLESDVNASAPEPGSATASGRFCDSASTTTAEAWWSCIDRLQRTGQSDGVRIETELLKARFPEFETDR
jgi:hypothetical protein